MSEPKTLEAVKAAVAGENVLLVYKHARQRDEQFREAAEIADKLAKGNGVSVRARKSDNTVLIGEGKIRFMSFEEAHRGSRGLRCKVMFDECLQRDLETFESLRCCEVGL